MGYRLGNGRATRQAENWDGCTALSAKESVSPPWDVQGVLSAIALAPCASIFVEGMQPVIISFIYGPCGAGNATNKC